MHFKSSNWQDIRRYYLETYVKFQEFGDKLFFIQSANDSEVRGKDEDGEPFILFLADEAPYNLSYVLPHKSIFQMGRDVFLLQRIPAKQYQRGLSTANTKIINVISNEAVPLSFKVLKAFVTKQPTTTLADAINDVKKQKGYALDSRFSYFPPYNQLRLDHWIIGQYSADKVLKVASRFKEEVNELIGTSPIKVNYVDNF